MADSEQRVEETPMRLMPRPPLGGRGANSTEMVEFATVAGAMGIERGDMVRMMHRLQELSMDLSMRALPMMMDMVKQANQARLNTVLQKVRLMPEFGGGLMRTLNGNGNISLVSRQDVINLLTAAMVESPPIT